MRLIDANAMREYWLENGENEYVYDTNAVLDSIDEQPTVYAVPVVRCKDCVNCKVEQMSIPGDVMFRKFPMYVCNHPRGEVGTDPLYMEADDFCSYGERRTDNA